MKNLNETALNKKLQFIKEARAIAIISAFCRKASIEENKKNSERLESIIRAAGYGFNIIKEFYEEEYSAKMLAQVYYGESYFITDDLNNPERLKKFIIKVGKLFYSECILFRSLDNENIIIDKNGAVLTASSGVNSSIDSIEEFFSARQNKPCRFEFVEKYTNPRYGFGGAVLRTKFNPVIDGNFEEFKTFCEYTFGE